MLKPFPKARYSSTLDLLYYDWKEIQAWFESVREYYRRLYREDVNKFLREASLIEKILEENDQVILRC